MDGKNCLPRNQKGWGPLLSIVSQYLDFALAWLFYTYLRVRVVLCSMGGRIFFLVQLVPLKVCNEIILTGAYCLFTYC